VAKVLLAVPPMEASTVTPPLGLGYLAAVLRQHHHDVLILHADARLMGVREFLKAVVSYAPDVLGMTVPTMAWPVVRQIVQALKADPKFRGSIVLGGSHPTALPELTLRQSGADAIVRGEGELVIPKLVEALTNKAPLAGIKGVSWSENGQVHNGEPEKLINDLDSIPWPAWDLMPPANYPDAPHQLFSRRFPVAPVITSRGCPFGCSFCASSGMWGRTWRRRDPKLVVDEIEHLVKRWGVREIHFEDDEFLGNEDRIVELCDELVARKLDLVWALPNGVRTNAITDRAAAAMAKSGCYEVGLGIDAPWPHQQERVGKPRAPDAAKRAIEIVQRHNMEVRGYWILGFDVDTKQDVLRTIDLMLELPADFAAIGVPAPLPGSADFKAFSKDLDLENFDWNEISYFKAIDSPSLSKDERQALLRQAVLRFYLRPRQIAGLLKRLRLRQLPFVGLGMWRYLTGMLKFSDRDS